MCGIAGTNDLSNAGKKIEDLRQALFHRGPDHFGHCQKNSWLLASSRLKIQDLKLGNQPFVDETNRYFLIYNGELYNKSEIQKDLENRKNFLTSSDTEVVFRALIEKGIDIVRQFNGMFSLCFYDAAKEELHLARDRFGVKPLFYHFDQERFSFASEIKSLLPLMGQKELNKAGIKSYLQTNYLHDGVSIFKNVRVLRPGQILRFKNNEFETKTYWDLEPGQKKTCDLKKLDHLIKQAVGRQMAGDRQIGVYLSSGIDSATAAYWAREFSSGLKAYNVSFKDQDFDESMAAKALAKELGIDFRQKEFAPENFIESFPEYAAFNGQPIADLGMYPLAHLTKFAGLESTVLLSGDGADELFYGYPTLKADYLIENFGAFIKSAQYAPKFLGSLLSKINKRSAWDYRLEKLLKGAGFEPKMAHYYWRTVFDDQELKTLGFYNDFPVEEEYIQQSLRASGLQGGALADFKIWLSCNNFLKVDSASMAHSVEARVPFLDNDLVDYVFSLDFSAKWDFFSNKKLLRKVMAPRLPSHIVNAKKAAFHPPYINWFRKELFHFAKDNLSDSKLSRVLGLKEEKMIELLNEHKSGKRNNAYKIYNLLFLEFWLRHWA